MAPEHLAARVEERVTEWQTHFVPFEVGVQVCGLSPERMFTVDAAEQSIPHMPPEFEMVRDSPECRRFGQATRGQVVISAVEKSRARPVEEERILANIPSAPHEIVEIDRAQGLDRERVSYHLRCIEATV